MEQIETTQAETVTVFGRTLRTYGEPGPSGAIHFHESVWETTRVHAARYKSESPWQVSVDTENGVCVTAYGRTLTDTEETLRLAVLAECPKLAERLGLVEVA